MTTDYYLSVGAGRAPTSDPGASF